MRLKKYVDTYLLFLLGSLTPLAVFIFAFHLASLQTFGVMLLIMAGFLFVVNLQQRKKVLWILFIATLFFCMFNFSVLQNGGNAIYNQITSVYANSSDYRFEQYTIDQSSGTFSVMAILSVICLVQYALQYIFLVERKSYFTSFMISFLFFFPTMLYSTPQPWILTSLLFLFWYALFFTAYHVKHGSTNLINVKAVMYLGCCVVIIMASVLLLYPEKQYALSSSAKEKREQVLRSLSNFAYDFMYGKEEPGEVDLGRAQDRFYTGTIQLVVTNPNRDQLYLKTYSGARYQDNHWNTLPAETYQKAKDVAWDTTRTWMNQQARMEGAGVEQSLIKVEDKRMDDRYAMIPYYLKSFDKDVTIAYDSYATVKNGKGLNEYWLWNREDDIAQPRGKSYEAYVTFINENYLDVPNNIQTLFSETLEYDVQHQFLHKEEIISYVKKYLESSAVYTLSPGKTPKDEDFVRYFLTENKRGYCVHFATTATLLLRYYGIPARYVEGYRVDAMDYMEGDVANVPDRSAHAWVEIFSEKHGWIPIEVTPSISSESEVLPPNESLENRQPELNTPVSGETKEPNKDPIGGKQTLLTEEPVYQESQVGAQTLKFVVYAFLPILGIGIFLAQWQLRLRQRKKAFDHTQRELAVRALYTYLQSFVVYGAVLSEKGIHIVEKAAFSQHHISEEEYQILKLEVSRETKRCYEKLPLRKKIVVKFMKALY